MIVGSWHHLYGYCYCVSNSNIEFSRRGMYAERIFIMYDNTNEKLAQENVLVQHESPKNTKGTLKKSLSVLALFILLTCFAGCNKDVGGTAEVFTSVETTTEKAPNVSVSAYKTQSELSTVESLTIAPQPENAVLSSDWTDYTVSVNGSVVVLPISYDDFYEKTGCTFEKKEEQTELVKPHSEKFVHMFTTETESIEIGVYLYNPTDYEEKCEDCIVIGILDEGNLNLQSVTSGVVFAGGYYVDGYTTKTELVSQFGEPDTKTDETYSEKAFIYIYYDDMEEYGVFGRLNVQVDDEGEIISICTKCSIE